LSDTRWLSRRRTLGFEAQHEEPGMWKQRTLLGLTMVLATSAAWAQTGGAVRLRAGAAPLGLQLAPGDWRGPCGSVAFPCSGDTGTLRLYSSETAPRSLSLQVTQPEDASALRMAGPPAMQFSLVGKAGIAPKLGLGVYGRVGTATRARLAGAPGNEGGVTYGVGLSWDFSRRGSAIVGWDTYDFRTAGGEARDVRATSLGLQWRY
jgi:OOP family OmpA-OmpF porin